MTLQKQLKKLSVLFINLFKETFDNIVSIDEPKNINSYKNIAQISSKNKSYK